jgi:lipopolysaccharide export system protein LptA
MKFPESALPCLLLALVLLPASVIALESDRQEPLEVNADSTEGTLGDGMAMLRGHVVIIQGTLLISADVGGIDG